MQQTKIDFEKLQNQVDRIEEFVMKKLKEKNPEAYFSLLKEKVLGTPEQEDFK